MHRVISAAIRFSAAEGTAAIYPHIPAINDTADRALAEFKAAVDALADLVAPTQVWVQLPQKVAS